MQRIYAQQFGGWWKLNETSAKALLGRIIAGEGYSLDEHGKRLARAPKDTYKPRHARLPGSTSNNVTVLNVLDMDAEDAAYHLEQLNN